MSRVIVYIDYENIHNILRKYFTNTQETDFLIKIAEYCKSENFEIIDIIVYCNFDLEDLHESFHQTWLLQHNVEIKHTSNKGKNFADLQIAVDILEQLYRNDSVDGYILVSSDKDMIPLVKAIRRNNKIVHLITTVKDCDYGVTIFPNKHIILEDILGISNKDGTHIEYTKPNIEQDIYNNLTSLISKNPANQIKVDYYINSLLPRFKILRYELIKHLQELESKSKVFVYEYRYGTKTFTAIIDDTYKPVLETTTIFRSNFFEPLLAECYNKNIR